MNNIQEYIDEVHAILERWDYPALVNQFDPISVALSKGKFIAGTWRVHSPMKCALFIYGATWHYQIIERAKHETKH